MKREGKNNFLDEMKTLFHNASNYIFSNCFEDKNTKRRQKHVEAKEEIAYESVFIHFNT